MKTRHGLGAALVTVALAPFVAFVTGACGGKVLAEAGGDAGPGAAATGSETASVGPTSSSTGTTMATGTTTGKTTATAPTASTSPTGTTTGTGPPAGGGLPFDGGVYNDGEPGSLVAIASMACTIPSAATSLEDTAPVAVARELAFCGPSLHFIQCPSDDGLQCSGLTGMLLFDQTCIDQCAADEYVVEVEQPGASVPIPEGCRIPAGAPGFPSYCCPCGAN